jgi:nitrate reductase molybdenum cofactor assembly chaperone
MPIIHIITTMPPVLTPPATPGTESGLRAKCPRHDSLAVLGRLLEYPGTDFDDLLAHARESVDSPALVAFGQTISLLNPDEREELYTATFDVTPRCVPYASIHLFGEENFKRGEFMAALHSQYEQAAFDTCGELPDHLAVLLRYASTLGEPARRELVEFCMLHPLEKIIQSLPGDHPYFHLMNAVDETLRSHYPGIETPLSPLDQMRQHGICPTVSDGCNCGPVSTPIIDGPGDLEPPVDDRTPISTTPTF